VIQREIHDEHGEGGGTSFAGEDYRLEMMMAWAGAGHWVIRWATQGQTGKATGQENKEKEKGRGSGPARENNPTGLEGKENAFYFQNIL
jgi:hypothetical protein